MVLSSPEILGGLGNLPTWLCWAWPYGCAHPCGLVTWTWAWSPAPCAHAWRVAPGLLTVCELLARMLIFINFFPNGHYRTPSIVICLHVVGVAEWDSWVLQGFLVLFYSQHSQNDHQYKFLKNKSKTHLWANCSTHFSVVAWGIQVVSIPEILCLGSQSPGPNETHSLPSK